MLVLSRSKLTILCCSLLDEKLLILIFRHKACYFFVPGSNTSNTQNNESTKDVWGPLQHPHIRQKAQSEQCAEWGE